MAQRVTSRRPATPAQARDVLEIIEVLIYLPNSVIEICTPRLMLHGQDVSLGDETNVLEAAMAIANSLTQCFRDDLDYYFASGREGRNPTSTIRVESRRVYRRGRGVETFRFRGGRAGSSRDFARAGPRGRGQEVSRELFPRAGSREEEESASQERTGSADSDDSISPPPEAFLDVQSPPSSPAQDGQVSGNSYQDYDDSALHDLLGPYVPGPRR